MRSLHDIDTVKAEIWFPTGNRSVEWMNFAGFGGFHPGGLQLFFLDVATDRYILHMKSKTVQTLNHIIFERITGIFTQVNLEKSQTQFFR